MSESSVELSIVVPVFNAEEFIERSLAELVSYLKKRPGGSELIVVDDGSSDSSAEIAERFAATSSVPIQVLRMEDNQGKGAAVTKGMDRACGRQRVFVDADLAFPAQAIDDVCATLSEGAPVVIANRVHPDSRYSIKPSFFRYLYTRHLAGRFFNLIVRVLLLTGIRDSQAGLKGFSAEAAEAAFGGWLPKGFSFDLAVLARARSLGFEIAQVPVPYRYDSEPTTVRFLADTALMLRDLALVRWRIGGPSLTESWREFSIWRRRSTEKLAQSVARPAGRTLTAIVGILALAGLVIFRLWIPSGHLAVYSWVLSIGALLLLTRGLDAGLERHHRSLFAGRSERVLFLLILALTAFLRFWHLGDAPPMIHGDSAECGIQGLNILSGRVSDIFDFSQWYNTPYVAYVPYALSFAIAGVTVIGLRLPTAILAVLSMVPLYFLVRLWLGPRAAQIATAMYAVSHSAIHFGRIGLWNIQTLFLELVAFALLMSAFKRRRVFPAALAGVAAGLALFSYTAGRLILVVGVAFLVLQFLQGHRRFIIRLAACFLLASVITAVPLALNYVKSPDVLQQDRSAGVLVLAEGNRTHLAQDMDALSTGQILWRQTVITLAGFVSIGDASGQYGSGQPLHSPITAALAVLGLLITLAALKKPHAQFLVLWAGLGLLLSSILIIDPPFYPRLVVLFPVPLIFVATALSRIGSGGDDRGWFARALAAALCLVVIGQAAFFSLTGYRRYLNEMDLDTLEWDVVEVFERVGTGHDYYLFGGPTITVLLPALKLFADGRRVVVGFSTKDVPFELDRDTVFVAFSTVVEDHSQLQQLGSLISTRFPQTHREVTYSHDRPQLVLYFSSPEGGSQTRPGGPNAQETAR